MIRLIPLILLFLVSLLTFLKAPTYHLWMLAIAATEYCLYFALFTGILTIIGIWYIPYKSLGNIIGIIAIIIYCLPVIKTYFLAEKVKEEIKTALNISDLPNDKMIDFGKLWKGIKKIEPKQIEYVSYKDTALNLDFYAAKHSKKSPCIIVVHGGSWSGGDNKQLPELNYYLSQKGYHVASISYRLAPKYQCPAPVEDIKNALIFLRKNADELQIDTNQFVLLGRSAGAQIALLAAYTLDDNSIKGVIDFYGPADMVWGYSLPSNPLVMDSRKVMEDYLGGIYDDVPHNYFESSPIEFVNKNSPPTLIIHGRSDVLVAYEHSRRLNEKLEKNNVLHYWLKIPWATHGFDFNLNGPSGQLSTYTVETFLNKITTK